MKKIRISGAVGALIACTLLAGCEPTAIADSDDQSVSQVLDSDLKKASYMLGYLQAESLRGQTMEVLDMQAYLRGASDFVAGDQSQVANEDAEALRIALTNAVQAKQNEASQAIRSAGDAYRAEYAQKAGVVSLPSGLLYEVITEGTGPKPAATDTVSTHYHGTLIDGTVFDSSVDRGQPASFPVNGVIAGWTEALQLMGVGSKWRLVIPPELGYGDRGAGGQSGPGATLVFEVELLEIN